MSIARPLSSSRADDVLWVKRVWQHSNITTGVTGSGYTFTFQGNDFPGWTSFAQLYESFIMRYITVEISPTFNTSSVWDQGIGSTPVYLQAVHSSTPLLYEIPPTSPAFLMNDRGYKRTRSNEKHIRRFVPTVPYFICPAASTTGLATDIVSGAPGSQWLSTNTSASLSHMGLRVYLDPMAGTSSSPIAFNVYITMEMGFEASSAKIRT